MVARSRSGDDAGGLLLRRPIGYCPPPMPPAISTARISRPLPRMWRKRPAASLRSIRIPTRRCFRYPRSRAQCESGRRKWATAANAFQLRAAVRFHPCPCRKGPARRTETSRSYGLPLARHLAAASAWAGRAVGGNHLTRGETFGQRTSWEGTRQPIGAPAMPGSQDEQRIVDYLAKVDGRS